MANLPVRVQFTLTCCICCQLSSIRRQGPKNTFRSEGEYRDQQLCNNDPKSIHHLCYWIIRYEKVIKTCVQEFSAKTGILKMFLFCLFFHTYVISFKLFIRICPSLVAEALQNSGTGLSWWVLEWCSCSRAGAAGRATPRPDTHRPPIEPSYSHPGILLLNSESSWQCKDLCADMEAGCEPRKVTHDLRVGFIIRPTLSVPRLPGRRMIADRVPPASQSPSPFLSIFLCCQSTLCPSPRVRANFSDSVTSLLIASLVQLSPVALSKRRR